MRDRTVVVDDQPIRFREWGPEDGQRIVLVHGGLANGSWWDHIAPGLASRDRTVVAIDLSGHGESGHRAEYSASTWADEVRAVAEAGPPAHRLPPPILVGHSMGGGVCWIAAQRSPAAFTSLVLVDSYIKIGMVIPRRDGEPRPLRRYPSRAEILGRFRTQPSQPVLLDYIVDHIANSSIRQHSNGWTWKHDPQVFNRIAETVPAPAEHPRRTTFIRAEFGITDRSVMTGLRRALGDALTTVEVSGAGHHIMLDRPCALTTLVRHAITAEHRRVEPA